MFSRQNFKLPGLKTPIPDLIAMVVAAPLIAFGILVLILELITNSSELALDRIAIQLVCSVGVFGIFLAALALMFMPRGASERGSSNQPITQQKIRKNQPEWIQQLPFGEVRKPDPNKPFQLLDETELAQLVKGKDQQTIDNLYADIAFLDHELLRLFRERDYDAKMYQTRYRRYQIGYMVLSALATFFGSLLALSLSSSSLLVAIFSFCETLVALVTTYLATISGREPLLQKWLSNRHKCEALRREYFKYLMNLDPYDGLDSIQRRKVLSLRAATINLLGTAEGTINLEGTNEEEDQIVNDQQPASVADQPVNG